MPVRETHKKKDYKIININFYGDPLLQVRLLLSPEDNMKSYLLNRGYDLMRVGKLHLIDGVLDIYSNFQILI